MIWFSYTRLVHYTRPSCDTHTRMHNAIECDVPGNGGVSVPSAYPTWELASGMCAEELSVRAGGEAAPPIGVSHKAGFAPIVAQHQGHLNYVRQS